MNIQNNMLKALLSVTTIVILAKILGFVKQIVTASAFGTTIHTDLIALSQGFVSDLDYLLTQTLITAFIPIYIYSRSKSKESADLFVSNTIKIFLCITIAMASLIMVFSEVIASIIAPSYSDELLKGLAEYIRIVAPALILIAQLAIINALLKANESFVQTELLSVNQSIIIIVLILAIGGTFGPDTLIVSFYAYAIVNLFFLIVCARKVLKICSGNPFTDNNVRKLLTVMGPLVLGYSMVFLGQLVDKIIVSGLGEGTVTSMAYGATLSNFISTFIGTICGVLFTYITKSIVDKKEESAAALTMQALIYLITFFLPISILTVGNATDIVTIVFKRGAFDLHAVERSSLALMGYGFMFVPYIFRELFNRLQYAYGESKRPMINGVISIVCNIFLSILLSIKYGILGVTVSTSISVLICAILNYYSICRKNRFLILGDILQYIPQWLTGSILCLAITSLGQKFLLNQSSLYRFLFIFLSALGCYYISVFSIVKPLVMNYVHRLRK